MSSATNETWGLPSAWLPESGDWTDVPSAAAFEALKRPVLGQIELRHVGI